MTHSHHRLPTTGHTLFELMVVVALLGTISAIAAPPVGRMLGGRAVAVELERLEQAFHRARQAATRRGHSVVVCPSPDGDHCGRDWSGGWMAFVNDDGDAPPRRDSNEARLVFHRPDARVRLTSNRATFSVRADWRRSTNGTMIACDTAGRAAPRGLIVSFTGRPRRVSAAQLPTSVACP